MPRPLPAIASEPVLDALRSAASVKEAARKLGMKVTNLSRYADSATSEVAAAYAECSARGAETRGVKVSKPIRWAVIWRDEAREPVRVWTVEAVDAYEAHDVAARVTGRQNLTIVQEAKR